MLTMDMSLTSTGIVDNAVVTGAGQNVANQLWLCYGQYHKLYC